MMRDRRPGSTLRPHALSLGLTASAMLLLAPLWQGLEHGDGHHGPAVEHTASSHAEIGHEQCDGWKVVAAGHEEHRGLQFEAAERSCHQHHGLCTGHSTLSGPASSLTTAAARDHGERAAADREAFLRRLAAAHPPCRGPPAVV